MVHLVPDEGVDSGPVLAQEIVPIQPGDTLETLEAAHPCRRTPPVGERIIQKIIQR